MPGMLLVLDDAGVPAMRAPAMPLRWPGDSLACAGSYAATPMHGDSIVAAWWRFDSTSVARLMLARSPDSGIHWDEPTVVAAAAPGTRACVQPPPGLASDAATGRIAVAYHGVAGGLPGLVAMLLNAAGRPSGPAAIVAPGGIPRAAAVALAGDVVAVAYESPATTDDAVWLAIFGGARHISGVPARVTPDSTRAFAPAVALRAGRIAVAWNEIARGGGPPVAVVRTGRIGN